MSLYHYTIGYHLPAIVGDGRLRANARHRGSAMPVLWLSTHPVWEPSAVKQVVDADGTLQIIGREQLVTRGRGVFRFVVAPTQPLFDWAQYVAMSGVDPELARHLEDSGRRGGADPAQWRVCLADVPAAQWLAIELYAPTTSTWIALERRSAPQPSEP